MYSIKIKRIILVALFSVVSAIPVYAEFYKYVDENGNVFFTDNLAEIPKKYMEQTKSYKSIKTEVPAQDQTQRADEISADGHASGTNTWDERLRVRADEIMREKEQLNNAFQNLQAEKSQLEGKSPDNMSTSELNAHELRLHELNEKIEDYQKRCEDYKNKVQLFNKSIYEKP